MPKAKMKTKKKRVKATPVATPPKQIPRDNYQIGEFVWLTCPAPVAQTIAVKCGFADVPPCPPWPCKVIECSRETKQCILELLGLDEVVAVHAYITALVPLHSSVRVFSENRDRGLHASNAKISEKFKAALEMAVDAKVMYKDFLGNNSGTSSDSDLMPPSMMMERMVRKRDREWSSDLSSCSDGSVVSSIKSGPGHSQLSNSWLQHTFIDIAPTKGDVVLVKYMGSGKYFHPAIVEGIWARPNGSGGCVVKTWNGSMSRPFYRDIIGPKHPKFRHVDIAKEVFDYGRIDDKFHSIEFLKEIDNVMPELLDICKGQNAECWRYTEFVRGVKSANLLAKKVGRGPLSLNEYNLLMNYLRQTVIDSLGNADLDMLPPKDIADSNARNIAFSRFIDLVLVAEAIIRIISRRTDCSLADAERSMMESPELDWVTDFIRKRSLVSMQSYP